MEFIDYISLMDYDEEPTAAEREILASALKQTKEMLDNAPHMHIMVVDSEKLRRTGHYYWRCTCGMEIEKNPNE